MTTRITSSKTVTRVWHTAEPVGRERENGPHLGDLRAFVKACEGLPDDARVWVEKGHMSDSGRYDVNISLQYQHPKDEN